MFSEEFMDNMKMWALAGQWAIGPAVASAGGLDGGDDPLMDHSASDNNGVAGTAIGGLVAPTGGISEYLTSPAFERFWDASARAPYLWDRTGRRFVTFDDPQSLREKARFVKERGLGGVMYWEHSHDPEERLLGVLARELR